MPQTFTIWLPGDVPLRYQGLEIAFPAGAHPDLVKQGETFVPAAFTVLVDRTGIPRATLDIERVLGQFRCTRLVVLPRTAVGHLESTELRQIRIPALVSEAIDLATYIEDEITDNESVEFVRAVFASTTQPDSGVDLDAIAVGDSWRYPAILPVLTGDQLAYEDGYRSYARELRRKRERRSGYVTDEAVAAEYRAALGREPVTAAVADAFGWELQTAANRICQARAAGLLPPTIRGLARG
jgi:hypothetical protein